MFLTRRLAMFEELFGRQYAQPQGVLATSPVGAWCGSIARKLVGLLPSSMHVLKTTHTELGFGPGFALQQLSRTVRRGFIAGVDVADDGDCCSRRNARAVRRGLVQHNAPTWSTCRLTMPGLIKHSVSTQFTFGLIRCVRCRKYGAYCVREGCWR